MKVAQAPWSLAPQRAANGADSSNGRSSSAHSALDAAGLVHGRANHGEVEAAGGADIAVDDLAEVEGDVELQRRLARRGGRR